MDQQFTWRPGDGIDASALARIRSHFPRPTEPMGEAWFMSEKRKMFPELQQDLEALTAWELQVPLQEIASGTSAFGPLEEWRDWYHYLLAQLLPRSHDRFVSPLLELLITSFVALYPNGVLNPPYPQFQQDVLSTLGRSLMEPDCWDDGQIVVGSVLHRSNNNPNQVWCWWDASGDFSASLFLCLKYLPTPLVADWFHSVLSIDSPHWRAQVIVWLVGAHEMLRGLIEWPSQLTLEAYPAVHWDWSHCLGPDLATDESGTPPLSTMLSKESCAKVLEVVRGHFTEEIFLDWLESISTVHYLQTELADIPATFERLYIKAH